MGEPHWRCEYDHWAFGRVADHRQTGEVLRLTVVSSDDFAWPVDLAADRLDETRFAATRRTPGS